MRNLYTCVAVAMAITMAYVVKAESRAQSTEQVKDQLMQLAAKHSGDAGTVTKAGKGRFAVVSSQTFCTANELQSIVSSLSGQIKFPIEIVTTDASVGVANVSSEMRTMGVDVAVFLISDASLPMSVVAMEDRWAIVYVSKLGEDTLPVKVKKHRMHKELSRVVKALFSSVNTHRGGSSVAKGSDLDAVTTDPIDANSLINIVRGLPSCGLVAPRTVPYHRACQEGWAPAPTNEAQKAIWDKYHEIPTGGIEIKFDPAKGE